ncbi:hypothetical protein GUJ93_ZPchr0006g45474 [Zizania palustris]|uniref:Uncharacterized protein n=1 Tax=Zizania palustris TaxID=103762 RepID=A0A8J5SUX2_ZIZPA|nr:hypothetical protein GUJ93_ZPchr0006g45474 [Zizania palustris]
MRAAGAGGGAPTQPREAGRPAVPRSGKGAGGGGRGGERRRAAGQEAMEAVGFGTESAGAGGLCYGGWWWGRGALDCGWKAQSGVGLKM